jgi:peptide deformylase
LILKIRTEGDPVLRKKAAPVTEIDDRMRQLATDMLETMYAAPGVGLAAPQVGESVRLVVVDDGHGPYVLFNPEIVEAAGAVEEPEACLSIPGVQGMVRRAAKVVVRARSLNGSPITVVGAGLLAKALQHEIDHLDGVLFIDKATEIETVEDGDDSDAAGEDDDDQGED